MFVYHLLRGRIRSYEKIYSIAYSRVYRSRVCWYNRWMGKATSFTLPFVKKEKVAKDTYTFYFDRKNGMFSTKGGPASGWDFIPGQYVRIALPHDNADDRGTTRYFTISSSPLNKEYLTITTKNIQSTFKNALFNLKKGTEVTMFGPMGWFLLPKDEMEDKVFIAGGIGVTPFHSLLTTLRNEELSTKILLIVSFSDKEHAVFYDKLMDVAKTNSQINVVYSFSRVSKELIEKQVGDLQKPVYYIVGPEEMVAGTKALLLDLGIDEEKIQTEDFTGY